MLLLPECAFAWRAYFMRNGHWPLLAFGMLVLVMLTSLIIITLAALYLGAPVAARAMHSKWQSVLETLHVDDTNIWAACVRACVCARTMHILPIDL